ncbi:hypothetical protein HMPREF9372_1220 [Sporosarcina newyorkensis 2681]|uniref:Uncharacterized protein n=1 Tax=Sporosarcina newyorkensis 2681 TaxID=1027292 RepID=F9DQZ0_9BACL|nr:hypothetical protein HMPREF9372_1220 [Sporosarcina newyorkensis 2681]
MIKDYFVHSEVTKESLLMFVLKTNCKVDKKWREVQVGLLTG